MNIYIGYKYRNFKDKEGLKSLLAKISDEVTALGHNTFILGRDEFDWNHHGSPSKSIFPIIKNMRKNDVFLAVVECASRSNGLFFESLCARLFGKKMILAVKKDVSPRPFSFFSHNVIKFENYEDLLSQIKEKLPSYL
jgi:hypothetical protein